MVPNGAHIERHTPFPETLVDSFIHSPLSMSPAKELCHDMGGYNKHRPRSRRKIYVQCGAARKPELC